MGTVQLSTIYVAVQLALAESDASMQICISPKRVNVLDELLSTSAAMIDGYLQNHPFGGYPNASISRKNASLLGESRPSIPIQGDAMADNLSKRGPQDRSRVNVNEPWEVNHWCAEFKCTEIQLRAAVKAVGVMVVDVRRHLSK